VTLSPIRDSDGGIIGASKIARDITDRKSTEAAAAHLAAIVRSSEDAIIGKDLNNLIISWNRGAEKVFGYSAKEMLGTSIMRLILPENQQQENDIFENVKHGQSLEQFEALRQTRDGRLIDVSITASPIQDTAGKVVGVSKVARDISERKRTEGVLKERDEQLRLYAEHSPVASAMFDRDMKYLVVSRQWMASYRLGSHSIIGRSHYEIFPQMPLRWIEIHRRCLAGAIEKCDEDPFPRADGTVDWLSWEIRPWHQANGTIGGIIIFSEDISARKQSELVLRESEERFRTMANSMPQLAWIARADGFIFWYNDRWYDYTGTSPQKMEGWGWQEVHDPAVLPLVMENWNKSISSGQPFEMEFPLRGADGHFRTFLSRGQPLRDASGKVFQWLGTNTDITVNKEAENRLRDQLSRLALFDQITRSINERLDIQSILQAVLGNLEDNFPLSFCCFCLHDEKANTFKVAQIGTQSEALALELGLTGQAVIPLDGNGLSHCALGQMIYEPEVSEMDYPFPRRLASVGLHSLIIAPMPVEGRVVGFLIVARRAARAFASGECDFLKQLSEHVALASHQAKLHSALQTAYDDLRRTQAAAMQQERLRAFGQMASGIAHDINNAISPVMLYTESLLESEPNLSVRARDYLQTIRQSTRDVAETIARMREFYRQRGPQLTLTAIKLNVIAEEALELTRVRWSDEPHQQGIMIQLQTEFAPNLPEIMGVESEIRGAMVNLIFNAVDAMPKGGTLTLRTTVKPSASGTGGPQERQQVCLELSDTGIGMDEAARRQCLEPFFTTKGERGTGLGLAMVYGMVKRHSAGIEIESALGEGTKVRLIFPVSKVFADDVTPPPDAKVNPAILRILFIDDDPILIKSMRHALEGDGHTVVTATGGQEGIHAFLHAQASQQPFAVVITDLGMPYVDGRKVASAVKAAAPATPMLLLTGWGQRLEAEGEIPAQIDRLLSKPPQLRDLREALAACCPAARSGQTKG
jgi:PAS domain S-box-containing protein